MPLFASETVMTDHGSIYRNHHLVEAERVLRCNVLATRVLRSTSKAAFKRAFGMVRQLMLRKAARPERLVLQ
ncbi:hypothetical protein [Streptomyces lavendulae]|uniref:hypothetical protein n=1 Tax=Streptomyces lavendulae TaxID=1914 RepID=UPI0024A3CBA3|nr:hypothetical protein Slala05_81610 [Streptomyces lavendulae subsp. lavendulae]